MRLASASAAALMALSTASASAQSWTGATSTDWTDGSNWSGGAVPVAGNVVNINTTSPSPTVLGGGGAATGATGNLSVGVTAGSSGNLTIQNGSTLTSGGATLVIGVAGGSNGAVTVSGTGSQWITSGSQINLGASGNGTLNIQNGGQVVAQSGVTLGTFATGTGTLNINSGGTLETTNLARSGVGAGQVNFDNAILRARINNNFFISGFTSGALNIAAGGLTVDSQAFTVSAGSGFSGVGGLTKIGTGTFNLRASNTYTGATVIQGGTLALANSGSVAASSRVVANGTFSISGITAAGTSIQSLAGSGSVALGAKDLSITNANDQFAGVIGGTGGLTLSGGTQTLAGANTYNGATTVNGGTLRAGAANTFSAASAVTVASGGTLDLAGFDQTLTSLANTGIVSLGGAPGTTLTVTGNYVGSGGTVQLNSRLGGDSSPTDLLRVQGSTSGTSSLRVNNVGGAGAPTVEGIKVVDVVGASNGSFSLLGSYVLHGEQAVVGGAYAYTLQKNGVATPGDGDWYLRSSLINPPPATPSGPLYQPGVPLYENYAQVLLGMNDLPTLQQRAGNRYWGGSNAMARAGMAPPVPGAASPTPTAFWGRIEGGHSDLQPSNTTGSTYKADQLKVQMGLDGLALENERGRLIVGLTAQYGLTTADVASFFGNGRIRVEGTGVGATLTWYGDNGFYVDAQAQSMFYRSDLSSVLAGSMTHGNEGVGYAFSAETGKRIGLGNGWSLTPQAQLSYAKVAFDGFADRFGAQVALHDGDSLLGRAGLAINHQRTWNDGTGIVRSDVYGIANLRYEFLSGTRVDVAGTGFANAQDRLWASIGGGGTYSWASGRYAIFGEVSYNASLDNSSDNRNYKGTGGFRLTW